MRYLSYAALYMTIAIWVGLSFGAIFSVIGFMRAVFINQSIPQSIQAVVTYTICFAIVYITKTPISRWNADLKKQA